LSASSFAFINVRASFILFFSFFPFTPLHILLLPLISLHLLLLSADALTFIDPLAVDVDGLGEVWREGGRE